VLLLLFQQLLYFADVARHQLSKQLRARARWRRRDGGRYVKALLYRSLSTASWPQHSVSRFDRRRRALRRKQAVPALRLEIGKAGFRRHRQIGQGRKPHRRTDDETLTSLSSIACDTEAAESQTPSIWPPIASSAPAPRRDKPTSVTSTPAAFQSSCRSGNSTSRCRHGRD